MKLFGTGGSARTKNNKPTLTKKQKTIRIVITVVAILVALVATGCAVWFTQVKPPDVHKDRPSGADVLDEDDEPEGWIEMGERVDNYFTFVVGAVDEDKTRTDALMVCGFDVTTQKINILNIPRDTMCNSTRRGAARKINAAYGTKKGIEQTKADIKKIIGFAPDYHIVVNFKGIADIVDAIGGVDYEIPFRMYYKDPTQNLSIDFKPGMRHMSGEEVVEFLRWRKNNGGVKTGDANYDGSDSHRIDKQQEFLKYLATQVLDIKNTPNIPKIAKAVFDNVETNFSWGNMLWMAQKATGTPSENIKMHTLPGYDSYSYAGTSENLSFFFPKERETLALVNEYFNPYVNKLTNLDIVSGPNRTNPNPKPSGGSSSKDDKDDEPAVTEPTTPEATDPEAGDTTTPENKPSDGNGGTTGGGTTTPPADDGTTGGTTTPPADNGGTTGGGTTTPPADNGGTTGGGTTTPPADNGGTTTTPPADNGGTTDSGTTPPPPSAIDPEA